MKCGGCWIFLSHASEDIDMVRRVRNTFEKYGQNPLAFHLRCLDEKYPKKEEELWDLIYREIDAREWFVYCKSPRSEKNKNVLRERQYIEKSGKNKIWMLDLTEKWEIIESKIYKICRDLEVFISYSSVDRNIAKNIQKLLIEKDYAVWTEANLKSGDYFATQIDNAISRCVKQGFFVIIISDKSNIYSLELERELEYAINRGTDIIPIVIGDICLPNWCDMWLGTHQYIRMTKKPSKSELKKVVKRIDDAMLKKIHNTLEK